MSFWQKFKQGIETWGLGIRPGGTTGYLGTLTHTNTTDRTYTLPDKSDTFAMLSDVTSASGFFTRIPVADTNYTITATTPTIVSYTNITAARNVYLPAATASGQLIWIADESGLLSNLLSLTILPNGSDTIEGQASFVLEGQYAAICLEANGSNKWTVFIYEELPIIVLDANYTATAREDSIILFNTLTATRTVTLPSAATTGQRVTIGDMSGNCSATVIIYVAPAGTDTIGGSTSPIPIVSAYGTLIAISNGSGKWSYITSSIANPALGQSTTITFGDATNTSYTLTHNLYSTDCAVTIWETGGNKRKIDADIEIRNTSATQITVVCSSPPGIGALRADITCNNGVTVSGDRLAASVNSEIQITNTANLTIGYAHNCVATGSTYTVTLPPVGSNIGLLLSVRIDPSSTVVVTLKGNGTDLINGSNTRIMQANESAELKSTGTQWVKVSGVSIPMSSGLTLTGNQTFANSVSTALTFTTSLFNNGPTALQVAASSRIVIQRPGNYRINYQLGIQSNNSSQCWSYGTVWKNGSTSVCTIGQMVIASNDSAMSGGAQVVLAAGDYLTPYFWYSGGSFTTTVFISGATWNRFELIEIIGW